MQYSGCSTHVFSNSRYCLNCGSYVPTGVMEHILLNNRHIYIGCGMNIDAESSTQRRIFKKIVWPEHALYKVDISVRDRLNGTNHTETIMTGSVSLYINPKNYEHQEYRLNDNDVSSIHQRILPYIQYMEGVGWDIKNIIKSYERGRNLTSIDLYVDSDVGVNSIRMIPSLYEGKAKPHAYFYGELDR